MVIRLAQPNSNRPLLDDRGVASTQFNTWLKVITDGALIIGTGSPEGVVEANQGAKYMDEIGVAGAISYIKRNADILGDKTKGWILV